MKICLVCLFSKFIFKIKFEIIKLYLLNNKNVFFFAHLDELYYSQI